MREQDLDDKNVSSRLVHKSLPYLIFGNAAVLEIISLVLMLKLLLC